MKDNENERDITGTIAVHTRGFGFLDFDDDEGSAFVTPPDLNDFLAGDRATARVTTLADGRMNAKSLRLVGRDRDELFGAVVRRKRFVGVHVDPTVANTDWRLLDCPEDVPDGAPVIARIVPGEGTTARFERAVAPADASLERVRVRHELRTDYPAAPDGGWTLPRNWRKGRRDLRDLPTVTIDGPTSRDLDDAVSVLPATDDGGLRVFVSIADVDLVVTAGSPADVEACQRGTSVYLAGQVINMLPPAISEDALSLRAGVDRPTMTVELRIDPDGDVTSTDLYASVIKSDARLTYSAVTAFLDQDEPGDIPPAVLPTLRWLRTAAARLDAVRGGRGGMKVLREEAYITVDAETREPTGVDTRTTGSSEKLIERLMVAANEAVAGWLVDRGLPGMYRVHEEPTAERVQALSEVAQRFGFELGLSDRLSPMGLAALQAQVEATSVAPAMNTVLQSILGPARYTVHPAPHYGLAAPCYLHFTSPIRRYADLVVHRIVKAYLAGARDQEAGDPELEALGVHLNDLAWRASRAEAERHRMLAARLFAGRVGERFRANVVAVQSFGLIAQLADVGVSGTVQTEGLPGGPYHVEHRLALVSDERRFSVGDRLDVIVKGVSEELGRIELDLV